MEVIHSVSIVMATYNGERFLREQLDSILAQTYPIHELIVQDDCSTDSTLSILEEYERKYPFIHIYRNTHNVGFKLNFETACAYASGEYVAFSDQDDIWMPDHIEVLINTIDDKILACGNALLVDSENNSLGYTTQQEHKIDYFPEENIEKLYQIFYRGNPHQGASMLIKREALVAVLPIPQGVNFHDTWIASCACVFGGMNVTQHIITRYRQHGHNVTTHFGPTIWRELKRHTHTDYCEDRINIAKALNDKGPDKEGMSFLTDFELYVRRHNQLKYRLWCWNFRSCHYREIYCTKSNKYKLIRALQYIITPPVS